MARTGSRASRRPRISDLLGARLRDRDPRRHRAARDRARLSLLGCVECAGLRRGRRRECSGFDRERTRHALGIAEYFGPRGQILRVCDQPTMVKDGSGWGAHAGVTAALLPRDGFTGAPAVTVEGDDGSRSVWGDLGARWRIREQYFKAYPVCRWAQPAVEAALALQREHRFDAGDVAALAIESFREAVALGARARAAHHRGGAIQPARFRSPRRSSTARSARTRSARAGSTIRAFGACSAR